MLPSKVFLALETLAAVFLVNVREKYRVCQPSFVFFFNLQYWKELKKEKKIVKCCVPVFWQFYLNSLEGQAFKHSN